MELRLVPLDINRDQVAASKDVRRVQLLQKHPEANSEDVPDRKGTLDILAAGMPACVAEPPRLPPGCLLLNGVPWDDGRVP
jgi:hypothetical protein